MGQLIPIPVLINQISYAWSDVQLSIAKNLPTIGITEINYSQKRKVTSNYGAGSQPITKSFGNVEYTGSITIYKEEYEALKAIALNGDITQIPMFTINIAYMNENLPIVVEKLLNCNFTEATVKIKQNDANIMYTIPISFAGIQY